MKQGWRKRKKALWLAGLVVLAFLVGGLLMPWWFPWALGKAARRSGVEFRACRSLGWNGAVLEEATARFGKVRLSARTIQLGSPLAWLIGASSEDAATAMVNEWELTVAGGRDPEASPEGSVPQVLDELDRLWPQLQRWLPRARFTQGKLRFEAHEIEIPRVEWNLGRLSASLQSEAPRASLSLQLLRANPGEFVLRNDLAGWPLSAEHRLKRAGADWELNSSLGDGVATATLSARFGRAAWPPSVAQLVARDVGIPASQLGWEGYERIAANSECNWRANRLEMQLRANARPRTTNDPRTPPLELSLGAHGDVSTLAVDRLALAAPFARLELASPAMVSLKDAELLTNTSATAWIDFSKTGLEQASGIVTGVVRLAASKLASPNASFLLQGGRAAYRGAVIEGTRVEGRLEQTSVALERASVGLGVGTEAWARGTFDWAARTIADGHWGVSGTNFGIAVPVRFEQVNASGTMSGSLARLAHTGQALVEGLQMPGFRTSDAEAAWRGEGLGLTSLSLSSSNLLGRLHAEGALLAPSNTTDTLVLELNRLDCYRANEPRLRLERPSSFTLTRARAPNGSQSWALDLSPLELRGDGRQLKLSGGTRWPRQGTVKVEAAGLNADDIAGLLAVKEIEPSLDRLEFAGQWDDGPLDFSLQIAGLAARPLPSEPPVTVAGEIRGGPDGLRCAPLSCQWGDLPPLVLSGQLPFSVLAGTNGFQLASLDRVAWQWILTNSPSTQISLAWTNLGTFVATDPSVELRVSGEGASWQGTVRLRNRELLCKPSPTNLPIARLADLVVDASLEPLRIRLNTGTLLWEGQPMAIGGELPLSPGAWNDLIARGRLPDWREAEGWVRIAQAPISAFTNYLPEQVRPEGELTLELTKPARGPLDGFLAVTNAALRNLPTVGPVRDIHARVAFRGEQARLGDAGAVLGGVPVQATGEVDFGAPSLPRFDLRLTGTNVALVRQLGIVVRADVNLRLASSTNGEVTLGGQLALRDSLCLQDLKILAPAPGAKPVERPPYFSIGQAPFAKWRLDLRVKGDEFLYLRTPVFAGTASAGLALQGTLGDPMLLGEAKLDSGRIKFPFGTLQVNNGRVFINSDEPHRPRLAANAAGSAYGYAIQLDIRGYADTPEMLFTSSPPLTSSQILALLTAGELPSNSNYFSQRDRAQRLAVFVGSDFLSRLWGSESGQERLTISSGQAIAASGKSTYSVEYRLSDRWSLVGEYDRFDALNANIKWKVYSK